MDAGKYMLGFALAAVAVGCGDSTATTEVEPGESTQVAEKKPSDSSPVSTSDRETATPISKSLPAPEGVSPQMKQIYKMLSTSTDGPGLAKFATACQQVGSALFDAGDQSAYEYLKQSANKYREAIALGFEFPDSIAEQILYNEACAFAKEGNKDGALKSLEEAVFRGYRNFEEAKQDPDLESLGDLTEQFRAWVEAATPKESATESAPGK